MNEIGVRFSDFLPTRRINSINKARSQKKFSRNSKTLIKLLGIVGPFTQSDKDVFITH